MQFLEQEICEFTYSIWSAILGLEVQRTDRLVSFKGKMRTLSGCVHFAGAWQGALVFHCNSVVASLAAAAMFGCEPDDAGQGELRDAVGEIANMTGGNLKALLPEPTTLSLRTVLEGTDYVVQIPGARVITQLAFECRGDPIQVTLLKRGAR